MISAALPYLIVGAGLAGSTLAWQLAAQGERVQVVDPTPERNSSRTAAGLINPISGQRWVLSPQFTSEYAAALDHYRQVETTLHCRCLYSLPQWRLASMAEQAALARRLTDPLYQPYLHPLTAEQRTAAGLTHDGVVITPSGYLDTTAYLDALQQWLRQREALQRQRIDEGDLQWLTAGVQWRGTLYRAVIFCEGYHAAQNRWFKGLPWQSAQGEILTLTPEEPLQWPFWLNSGIWLLPRSNGEWRLGASYCRDRLTETTTPSVATELQVRLAASIGERRWQLHHHQSGVRPIVADRQPLLGRHPHQPQVVILNGFGSKGGLRIPHFTAQLVALLREGRPLPATVDLSRYPFGA